MSINDVLAISTVFNGGQLAIVVAIVMEMRTIRRDVDKSSTSLDKITATVNRTALQVAAIRGRVGAEEEED